MAKKTETIVTLTDDLDGGKADRTVLFTVDGANYEIDLSKKNATAFAKALGPYVSKARKVKPTRQRLPRGTKSHGRDLAAIREWAKTNGYSVSDRGRIAASVVEAYDAAQ